MQSFLWAMAGRRGSISEQLLRTCGTDSASAVVCREEENTGKASATLATREFRRICRTLAVVRGGDGGTLAKPVTHSWLRPKAALRLFLCRRIPYVAIVQDS